MARRSSKRGGGRFSNLIWMLLTAVFGGSVGGYLNPDWPIIGPLIQNLASRSGTMESGSALDSLSGALNSSGSNTTQPAGGVPPGKLVSTQRPADKLLLASFNIQVFGTSKMGKPDVMSVVVEVLRQFDIVAIQEVRTQDDNFLPKLIEMINANGSRYHYLIGPRLGRTVSTEQYAFVYDTNRIEVDPSSVGTVGDPADLLHREPFVARFRPRTNAPDKAFSFWMVNIHTDPDEVKTEVDALADVFQMMRTARPDEDDVILLGDLNASETQLGKLGQIPGIRWVVSGVMTNTRQTKAYDNILFDGAATSEYTGRWGVFDLTSNFQLSREDALKVSDHFPVWAEFQIWEGAAGKQFAERLPGLRR